MGLFSLSNKRSRGGLKRTQALASFESLAAERRAPRASIVISTLRKLRPAPLSQLTGRNVRFCRARFYKIKRSFRHFGFVQRGDGSLTPAEDRLRLISVATYPTPWPRGHSNFCHMMLVGYAEGFFVRMVAYGASVRNW